MYAETSDNLMQTLNLSPKQYYARFSKLLNSGLVKRKHGKYTLTSFGKLVYQAQLKVVKAVHNHWKLKAIDAIKSYSEIPDNEHEHVVEELTDDTELKKFILGFHNTHK